MEQKSSKFQIVVLVFFGILAVGGLLLFALYKGGGSGNESMPITVWGTVDEQLFGGFAELVSRNNELQVYYFQKDAATFEKQLLEALATGTGPDAIILPHDSLFKYQNKLLLIPYSSLPENEYKNTFIQQGELFATDQGVYALPFAIDPMVMYWNRDLFTDADMPLPPRSWEEFLRLPTLLTKRDAAFNITQSAVAMGEYRNVSHAKDILSLILIQAGDPIVAKSTDGYVATLGESAMYSQNPAHSALIFYTQFADPVKRVYSWNRSLDESKNMFIANRLAVYFGYASEHGEIRLKNPNLNYDVAMMPQPQAYIDRGVKTTFGRMYGLAVVRNTKNPANTYAVLNQLVSKDILTLWNQLSGMPSVRRDSIGAYDPANAAAAIFASSALNAQAWLDPDSASTDVVFRQMIEDVTSGRQLVEEAIRTAKGQINNLLRAAR